METKHEYQIALLDGDLLIIAPSLPDSGPLSAQITPQRPHTPADAAAIAGRMYRREAEFPHLIMLWSD